MSLNFLEQIVIMQSNLNALQEQFHCFVSDLAETNQNWRFWKNFTLWDTFTYLCLFLSMRSGDWNLQLTSIKTLAPLFAAYDRPHYQKLIPQHLAKVLTMPKRVLEFLEKG